MKQKVEIVMVLSLTFVVFLVAVPYALISEDLCLRIKFKLSVTV